VNELRAKENRKQLYSQELRTLTALNLDGFEKVEERKKLSDQIRRLRGIQHYTAEAIETLAALPSTGELEAEARTAGLALQAAQATVDNFRKQIDATKAEEQRCKQAVLAIAETIPRSLPIRPKPPWWHKLLP
jgi:phage terminase Nu1 subunit (DNA packaging protein)